MGKSKAWWCVVLGMASCAASACIAAPEDDAKQALDASAEDVPGLLVDAGGLKPAVGKLASGSGCGNDDGRGGPGGGANGGNAWIDDAGAEPTGGFGGGATLGLDASLEPAIPRPQHAGELVITELLADPKTLDDASGEWFELWNPSDTRFDLQGCGVLDRSSTPHAIAEHVLVEPNAYVSIARAATPGFQPDAIVTFSLTNSAGQLALVCDGVEIDRVVFDKGAKFPLAAGASAALDPSQLRADANDVAAAWCLGTASYGPELGTPGQPNAPCATAGAPDASLP